MKIKNYPPCMISALLLMGVMIISVGYTRINDNQQKTDPNSLTQKIRTGDANNEKTMYKKLTPAEKNVIINKGTEPPFSGKFNNHFKSGVYTCKQCSAHLFHSSSKFPSHCGWPSFDDQIPGAVKMIPDADGIRTEIICSNCNGHLGHIFVGERYTLKNTRYCVNSISMDFIPADKIKTQTAIFASGCFWGAEHVLKKAPGVLATTVGYTGGHVAHPTYRQVCNGETGHAEAVKVLYDPTKTTYEALAKLFFETHDPTQVDRQGPDIGGQYRSAIFYVDVEQKQTAEKLVKVLEGKGLRVATQVVPAGKFWPAEDDHQDYYQKTGGRPSCHVYHKRF